MPKLYHVFVAHDFPNDQEYCSLCVAKSIQEATKTVIKDCAILPEDKLEVSAYEITDVDGYKVQLVKEGNTEPLLEQVLAMYGIETHQDFKIDKGGYKDTFYLIDEWGDLLYYNHSDEEYQPSGNTLGNLLAEITPDQVRPAKREATRTDLLANTLKQIGLETMQPFGIDDSEFPDHYYIDSFGDLYIVNKDSFDDEIHEYLTLGRILTQYYDKIITYKDDLVDD